MATYMIGLNADCFGRTLILTITATSRKPDQASVGFCESNGKFQQVNGLGDGDDTCARESSLASDTVGADRGRIHPGTEKLSPEGATDLSPAIYRWEKL